MYEANNATSHRLHQFLAAMTRLVDSGTSETELLQQGRRLLQNLLQQDDWLQPDMAQADTRSYQEYLLYSDPQDRFSVVSLVWAPGQSTPIHDHSVWGLTGVLRGSESCQPYSRMSDGRWVPAGLQIDMLPGDVEAVSPRIGDVHKVWNALPDQVSISIHVYGGNIGLVERHSYREDGSRSSFVSGYANMPGSPASMPRSPYIANQAATSSVQAPAHSQTVSSANAPAMHKPVNEQATAVHPSTEPTALSPAVDHSFAVVTYQEVRQYLLDKREIALVDVREEEAYALAHP